MKINLHLNSDKTNWIGDDGFELCRTVMELLGLRQGNTYTMYVSKIAKRGYRQVNLSAINSYWRWKLPAVKIPYSKLGMGDCIHYFQSNDIDKTLLKMFPSKQGTLYFRIVKNKPCN